MIPEEELRALETKKPMREEAGREDFTEWVGLELGSLELESTEQVISDKVPGKGSGGSREVHGAGNQAARNRRLLGREE